MRHRVGQRKLGRVTEHRIAMLRNQAEALIQHEHIETTLPKAKELRPFVERIITIAKRGIAAGDATLHARRLVLRDIQNRDVVAKLFDTIAPRFAARPGGYTRILRVGYRRGDSAEVAQIELVGSEFDPNAETAKTETAAAKPKGVGGRLRAAAERLRGKAKAEGDEGGEGVEGAASKKVKPARPERAKGGKADTRGKGAKTSTPRKAGGS
jgi:large subunit ribosomal protein L17